MPDIADRPGVHPPDGLLGSSGREWGIGEGGGFEWREGDTISEAVGVPAIMPPSVTYRAATNADAVYLSIARPIPVESWEIVLFPWEWYEEEPPPGDATSQWRVSGDDATTLCIPIGDAGEYSLTANVDFGEGNHATYRWHVIVPDSD